MAHTSSTSVPPTYITLATALLTLEQLIDQSNFTISPNLRIKSFHLPANLNRDASAIKTASASSAFAVIRDLISPVADEYQCAENEMLKTFGIWVGTSDRTLLSFELVSDVHISTRLAKLSYSVPDPEFLTGRHRQRSRNGIKHNLRGISIKTAELVIKKRGSKFIALLAGKRGMLF